MNFYITSKIYRRARRYIASACPVALLFNARFSLWTFVTSHSHTIAKNKKTGELFRFDNTLEIKRIISWWDFHRHPSDAAPTRRHRVYLSREICERLLET